MRADIVAWRSDLLAGADINADRIATLQRQIEALGPAPEDGTPEPEGVADRRAELDTQLTQAQAPGRAATEAYNRADGLIAEIDGILRGRSTELLFAADPAPINPLNWATAPGAIRAVIAEIRREIRVRTIFDLRRAEIRDGLPLTIGLAALGLLLLSARAQLDAARHRARGRSGCGGAGATAWRFSSPSRSFSCHLPV